MRFRLHSSTPRPTRSRNDCSSATPMRSRSASACSTSKPWPRSIWCTTPHLAMNSSISTCRRRRPRRWARAAARGGCSRQSNCEGKETRAMNVVEANGARIPAIGLGTMTLKDEICIDAIKAALRLGYRHLDTAERYGNEQWVGEGLHQGLAASGVKREGGFVTPEVYWGKLPPGEFERSGEESPAKLKIPLGDQLLDPWDKSQG